ncbi:E3 ubiquitin ligase TRAF3IP2 [Trichomycterus rosablanca]|uniref:E3 ubiquitin ligase TRAF3IP2 n=1 Tax=Trichomycterus rosablanca TaxID=2290929 RepID=UPI002F356F07
MFALMLPSNTVNGLRDFAEECFFFLCSSCLHMACQSQPSLNCPEENDETLAEEFQSGFLTESLNSETSHIHSVTLSKLLEQHNHPYSCRKLVQSHQFSRYIQQTPYPSQADIDRRDLDGWHYASYHSRSLSGCQPNSLPSYLPSTDYESCSMGGRYYPSGHHSLPSKHSESLSSLEKPGSLHSFTSFGPPIYTCHMMPHSGHPYKYGPVPVQISLENHLIPHHQPYTLTGLENYRHSGEAENEDISHKPRQTSPCRRWLSQEQRKVFVTYEADNEDHLKEVIKFVALLRNNGFDTHIDVFEQQLYSISKIDCMERYLNEKDYLIIIVISLKYFETVTGISVGMDYNERTSNTMYIHKQLQSEFIRNGCRNFRVIPVLFPGAKKSYVPTWLQNTHLYSWPRDRDDILRRLMRVEKYNPPPVGPLPNIVSMPI